MTQDQKEEIPNQKSGVFLIQLEHIMVKQFLMKDNFYDLWTLKSWQNLPGHLFFASISWYSFSLSSFVLRPSSSWNILQWSKNDFKSMNYTNGDYFILALLKCQRGRVVLKFIKILLCYLFRFAYLIFNVINTPNIFNQVNR